MTSTFATSPASVKDGKEVQVAAPASSATDAVLTTTVVLDTSVLMADPQALSTFTDVEIVIPLTVIDELDRNKTRRDEAGRNARTVLHEIEQLRLANSGNISTAVTLPSGSTLRIEPNGLRLEELSAYHLSTELDDHRIIAAALGLAHEDRHVRLVSNDASLRIKAALLGLTAEEHTPGRVGIYAPNRTGLVTVEVSYETIELARGRAPFPIDDVPDGDRPVFEELLENEFALLSGVALLLRRSGTMLVPVRNQDSAWGLTPKNKEQACALNLLMDTDVQLVALRGHAGTGKSIVAIAAGLEQVLERDAPYDQLMILRSMVSVGGEDMGFLPGDVAEKTAPWFTAVVDTMVALSGGKETYKQASDKLAHLIDTGKVATEPLTFMRGRSLQRTYVILDEAQNTEPSTVKTAISRLGMGSKMVMLGDDGQIDRAFVSSVTCGLNVAVDAFAGQDLFGQVFFTKGERSRLADLAAERM